MTEGQERVLGAYGEHIILSSRASPPDRVT